MSAVNWAASAIILLLAGCSSPSVPDGEVAKPVELGDRFFTIVDGQPAEADELPALTREGSALVWDHLQYAERGKMALLLLKVQEATNYSYDTKTEVSFGMGTDAGLESYEDGCVAEVIGPGIDGVPVPGEYLLGVATGNNSQQPGPLPGYSMGAGVVHGTDIGSQGGSFGSEGQGEGVAQAGSWLLFGVGISGVDARHLNDQTTRFVIHLNSTVSGYLLPSTSFHCAMGFRPLQGGSHTPAPLDVQVGGALEMDAKYGSAFLWDDTCYPLDGAPNDRASIRIAGQETTLDPFTRALTAGNYSLEPSEISVEQWHGKPWWIHVGLAFVPQEPAPVTHPGCLR